MMLQRISESAMAWEGVSLKQNATSEVDLYFAVLYATCQSSAASSTTLCAIDCRILTGSCMIWLQKQDVGWLVVQCYGYLHINDGHLRGTFLPYPDRYHFWIMHRIWINLRRSTCSASELDTTGSQLLTYRIIHESPDLLSCQRDLEAGISCKEIPQHCIDGFQESSVESCTVLGFGPVKD